MGRHPPQRGPYLIDAQLLRDRIPSPDEYPFSLPAVRHLSRLAFHPKVTFFVGENGSGKSTLIEALAIGCGLNPEGGSRDYGFETRASHSRLENFLRLARIGVPPDSYFLRAESFYTLATEVDRIGATRSHGGISLHAQSHGESFFSLFEKRFGFRGSGKTSVPGLYFLDEPEAALSPNRLLQFLGLLHEYCNEGSQFVIATHSPILMTFPESCLYVLNESGIHETPYAETEHFRVTKSFLNHPRLALKTLLGGEFDSE